MGMIMKQIKVKSSTVPWSQDPIFGTKPLAVLCYHFDQESKNYTYQIIMLHRTYIFYALVLIINNYYVFLFYEFVYHTYLDQSSFISKALIIRLFLVYLFISSNKNSTTQLFILIRFKSNNNLRKYQLRLLEPTY